MRLLLEFRWKRDCKWAWCNTWFCRNLLSLQQRRKLKVKDDQKKAQSAIRSRRKQMLNEPDIVEKSMDQENYLDKIKNLTETVSQQKSMLSTNSKS